jgi:hypothetical protein
MAQNKKGIGRKLAHAGGWQVIRRFAKMLPFGGSLLAVGLVGHDIKRKGVVRGVVNSGLDAVPVVGLAKNALELFTGDLISDKSERGKRKKI